MSPLMGLISDVSGEIWTIIYTGNYPGWTGPPDRVDRSPRQARLSLGSHVNLNVQQVLGGRGRPTRWLKLPFNGWKCSRRGRWAGH